ncbi:MAG: lysophospholipase [Bacteroidaceae bacterium]|nr:lysophospholipase [Bacteroidaceae bacterium]
MKTHHYITSSDSAQQLHYIVWQGDAQPRAVLQLVHGMEEYIERYDLFAEFMVALGWAVIGHDHLGHGQSGIYERGHFSDDPKGAPVLIEDIHKITACAHELWPNLPLCIMGHSMGSFLTRRYLCEYSHEVQAAVIMGSGWYSPLETGTALISSKITCFFRGAHTKSWLLTRICSLPFLFAFREEGKNAWLSVEKANVEGFTTDPLRGFGFTAGAYQMMYQNLYEVSCHTHFETLRRDLPVLFIAGEDDPVGGAKAVAALVKDYKRHGFADVASHVVRGKRHELFFEDDAQQTCMVVGEWLNKYARPSRQT